MSGFKLVEEAAQEWGVTSQHVQRLCRAGKVDGAVKRAGIWFIPDNAPNPIQNTKAGDQGFRFVGTKNNIFERAIELFMLNGFENVSVQDIADAVGIRQSAVYNHFKSKQELLHTIYEFYRYYYLVSRPTLEELEPILQEGSLFDIVNCCHYNFNEDIAEKMLHITKIVYHRKFTDERARMLAKTLTIEEALRYVEAIFQRAIDIGRIAPMDTHAMAVFVNGVRIYTMHEWVVNPDPANMMMVVADENALYKHATRLLIDLKPGTKKEE